MKTVLWLASCAVVAGACSVVQLGSQGQAIATSTLDSLRAQFKYSARPATDGSGGILAERSVIPDADAPSLAADSAGNLRPSGGSTDAKLTLPASADGATRLATMDGSMGVDVSLRSANASAPAAISGGNVVYVGGDARGGHYVETVLHDGVEGFVSFTTAPGQDVVFDVGLVDIEGLRLVSNTLEFLDGGGAPRLRMQSPVVVDSKGHVAAVSVSVPTCAYDDSAAAPWGRKVTPPGASACEVHLSWSDAGLTYPVLLDPSWTTTGSMTTGRRWHGAAILSTLKVLAIGGEGASLPFLSTCELYDPTSGTWAVTGEMPLGRRRFTTTTVAGGKILVAGGETASGKTAAAHLYDPTTGTWAPTGAMTSPRAYHDAVVLGTGQVLVAGGMDAAGNVLASSELYDPSSGTFSLTGALGTGRHSHTLSVLQNGKVLAAGGLDGASNVLASAELYDPSTSSWTPTGSLAVARYRHKAVVLEDGRVLFTAGYTNAAATAVTAAGEVYDASLGAFFDQDLIGPARGDHAAVGLPGNHVLVVGGSDGSGRSLPYTTDFGANNTMAANAPALRVPVSQATMTMMGTGYVLVAGGNYNGRIVNYAQKSGPYFYVHGRDGSAHQLQFTSISGSRDTTLSFGLLYDTTAFSVTYDWVGTSHRASVQADGTSLGTIIVAQKGDVTFTSADGVQQVTENRNIVTAHDVLFMDEKAVIVGPERTFDTIANLVGPQAHLCPGCNDWFFTVRENVSQMSAADQGNLWQALTDITFDTTQTTCAGKPCTYHVRAEIGPFGGPDGDTSGGFIQFQNCTPTSCDADMVWFDVDVVRAHYEVDHDLYPQFFQHHRRYLDQLESWITNPGGWQDSHGIYGILPYGHLPYWDSSAPIPDNGNSPGNNFIHAQLSGGGVPFGQGRNCHTGAKYNDLHGGRGTNGRVDTFLNPAPLPDPPGGCDWESLNYFPNQSYVLSYPTTTLCSANNNDWFWGDGNFVCGTGTFDPIHGFHTWHDCVHNGLSDGTGVFFGAFDSPGYPLFFLWHAWVDHFYQMRLDCYGTGP